MDIEVYKNFLAVIDTGSITAAAEHVHISQPSLSKQMKMLEECYGSQLMILNRGKHDIVLTEAGHLFYQKAKSICLLEESLKKEIDSAVSGVTGVLRLSISFSRSNAFIHKAIKEFCKIYPDVTYEIYEAVAYEQTYQLLHGISELGITSTALSKSECFEVLFSEQGYVAAVFNTNSPWLDKKKHLYPKDLKNIPLSLYGDNADIFSKICHEYGFTPNIVSINTTKSTTLQWAKDSIAVAIVPLEITEIYDNDLVVKIIKDKHFKLQKNIVKMKDRPLSKIAEKFVDFYQKIVVNKNNA